MTSTTNCNIVLIIFTVDLLATTGDTWSTWLSPVYPKLYSNDTSVNPFGRPITNEEDTWIGSLVNVGSMIGPFPFGFVAEKFGRKIGLLSLAVPHLISFLVMAFAREVYLYYIARLLAGLAIGGGYSLLPMYVTEVTENSNRGKMSATLNVFWTLGNLLSFLIGPFLSIMWFNLILACLPPIFFVMCLFICPETPYYLVGKNQMEKAEISLRKLRTGSDDIKKELEDIKTSIENEEHGTIWDIVKSKALQKALIISLTLVGLQQMSGLKAIVFYLQFIFDTTGSEIPSHISAIIFGLVLFASSFLTPFLSDRLGRRILLISSCLGIAISHCIIGIFFYLLKKTDVNTKPISWLPLLCLVFYVIFFNIGIGPISWTISSEMFPSSVRSTSSSLVSSFCWFVGFILTKCFNDMKANLGEQGIFWVFSGVTFVGFIFCIVFVPETKGKSFDEIQNMLVKEKASK